MINSETKLVAVIGNPVSHSMSPAMHNAAFRHLGLNYVYLAFKVENLKAAVQAMRELGFEGYSVTIPHKQNIIKYLDRIDPLAAKIGAVNTVVNSRGLLIGYNTDAIGAIESLKAKTSLTKKRIALLGAGGAARAVAFALLAEKAELKIFNRTFEKSKSLAKSVGCGYAGLDELFSFNPEIIINATSVGMHPNPKASPLDKAILKKGTIVFDMVYNPVETLLLKQARASGCETISGIEMLLAQGAKQFKLWTGKDAPFDVMRSAVLEGVKK